MSIFVVRMCLNTVNSGFEMLFGRHHLRLHLHWIKSFQVNGESGTFSDLVCCLHTKHESRIKSSHIGHKPDRYESGIQSGKFVSKYL